MEFNPDGSLKLPGSAQKKNDLEKRRMRIGKCIKLERDVVQTKAPKKCHLHISLSDAIQDKRFIDTIYSAFRKRASVPSKMIKIDEKSYMVEIGTDFKRCTDCCSLISEYRQFLDGNMIEKKGSCTFGMKKSFEYEDYFG